MVKYELAGYLKLNTDTAQAENKNERDLLEIERIYILRNYKRLGLGTKLLDRAKEIAIAKNKNAIWLGVWEKNEVAIKFIKKRLSKVC